MLRSDLIPTLPVPETIDIHRLKSGEKDEFQVAYEGLVDGLLHFTYELVPDLPSAEMLVTETFYDLFYHRAQIDHYDDIREFCFSQTMAKIMSLLVSRSQIEQVEIPGIDLSPNGFRGWLPFMRREACCRQRLYECLYKLPETIREIIHLTIFKNFSNHTISQRLMLSVSEIKDYKQIGLALLKEYSFQPTWLILMLRDR